MIAFTSLVSVVAVGASGLGASAAPAPTIASVQAKLNDLQNQSDALVEKGNQAQIQLDKAKKDAAAASTAVTDAKTKADTAMKQAISLAVTDYTTGGNNQLAILFTTPDPSSLLDTAGLIDQVSTGADQAIVQAKQAQVQLAQAQKRSDAAVKTQAKIAADLDAAKAKVDQNLQAQNKLLGSLKEQERQRLLAEQRKRDQEAAAAAARAYAAQQATARAQQQRAQAAAAAAPQVTQTAGDQAQAAAAPQAQAPADSAPAAAAPAAASGGASGAGQTALQWALTQLGKPYVFGSAGPNSYDCSGLTMVAFSHAGVSLPHSAAAQAGAGRRIPLSQAQPGDLVIANGYGHVGIYYGNGMMVNAPHTGSVVKVGPIYAGQFAVRVG